jgi:xanthine dehydrogenase molybdenum-binding subunit
MTAIREHRYLGNPAGKIDGFDKITGNARFGADFLLPGMLHGKILRSPYAHAEIRRIDVSKASRRPGVMAVVTGADFPNLPRGTLACVGKRSFEMSYVSRVIMAREKVHFHGQPVAAVAARTLQEAEDALEFIEIEYEPLPVVLDPDEAMKPDAPLLHDDIFTVTEAGLATSPSNVAWHLVHERGDLERGFAAADLVIERSFRTRMVHQGYIEPEAECALVAPDGHITVWAVTQGIFLHREEISVLFQVPPSRIRVIPMEVGGAFGGKEHARVSPVCVALSRKCGRPVRIVLTREEVLRATGPGAATVSTVKIGVKRSGQITALHSRYAYSGGCYPGAPINRALWAATAAYQLPNFKIEGYDVVTNKPKSVPYRAPGGTAATYAIEVTIDEVAQAIDMDPLQLRKLNISRAGDPAPTGGTFDAIGFEKIIAAIERHPCWTTPLTGRNRGRGLAFGFWPLGSGQAHCQVTLVSDGSINLTIGSVDLSGTRTGLAQIVAEELDVSLDQVRVVMADTDTTGYTDGSTGSRLAHDMGTAVHHACRNLLVELKQRAAMTLQVPYETIEYGDRRFFARSVPERSVSIADLALASHKGGSVIVAHGQVTDLQMAPATAGHVVDVEVDSETGKVNLLRYTSFQDVGFALNPAMVEGQMQGGATQGIGWALSEEYIYDANGIMKNATLLDYRMPTALDVPPLDCEIIEVPPSKAAGPYGIRGAGEMGIVLPPAAISNAITRATGVRIAELPMSPERIFWALKNGSQGVNT